MTAPLNFERQCRSVAKGKQGIGDGDGQGKSRARVTMQRRQAMRCFGDGRADAVLVMRQRRCGGEKMDGSRGDVRNACNSRDAGKLGDALRKTRKPKVNGKSGHSQVC